MATILVTGGAGFIGSHTADALISSGYRVIIVDNLLTGKKSNIHPEAVFYELDICDPDLSYIFQREKIEYVLHLAAQINVRTSVENPLLDAKINIEGTLNVLEASAKFGVKKLVFSSSGGAIYGESDLIPTPETVTPQPLSPYGIAKLCDEHYLRYYFQTSKLPFVALRYANVYGPRQDNKGEAGVVAIFIEKMLQSETPTIFGDGEQTRDFVYVKDVVKANVQALEIKSTGVYNVGTGQETNIKLLYQKIQENLQFPHNPQFGPLPAAEVHRSCLDTRHIQKEFSWQPSYTLDSGLKETVEWWKLRF